MALTITFLSFQKKVNSTKQPTETQIAQGVKYDNVTLKSLTNIDSPVLYLEGADSNLWVYNYCYIHDWGRYYFVKTCSLRHETIFECHLELDDLATFKTQILAASAFIVYSTNKYSDLLHDSRIAALSDVEVIVDNTHDSIFTTTPSYLLSVVGEDGINVLVPTDPNIIPGTLYSKSATDLISALCIQWSDAQACMLELKELPLAIQGDYSLSPAHVGKIDIGARSALNQYFNSPLIEDDVSISIPYTYPDFRLYSMVEARLYIPFVGVVEIPLESFQPHPPTAGRIDIHTAANPLTGSVAYTLKNASGEVVATYTGSFGRTLPLNASKPNEMIGAVTQFVSAAAAMVENKPATAIADIAQSMSNAVKFKGSVIGSFQGSYGEYLGTKFILAVERHIANSDPSNLRVLYGSPCGKVLSLANLSDYVQTRGFSISLDANKDVVDSINAKLDNGIYIQ